MKQERLKALDGTMLAAYTVGDTGMPVVLANGLGGPFYTWRPLLEELEGICRFYSWDYRGLYASEAPADRSSLTVEAAVDDQLVLMDRFGLEKVLVGGWSMGVQVALEFYRRHPDRVTGMILMNGSYGRVFHTAFKTGVSGHLLPPAIRVAQQAAPVIGGLIRIVAGWPHTIPLASSLRLVDPGIDRALFQDVAYDFGRLDLDLYFEALLRLGEHDAGDILDEIDVPVLIIAGEKDLMTPPEVTGKMLSEMPRAELFVVPRGTHYCLIEYPDLVSTRVKHFLKDHFAGGVDKAG